MRMLQCFQLHWRALGYPSAYRTQSASTRIEPGFAACRCSGSEAGSEPASHLSRGRPRTGSWDLLGVAQQASPGTCLESALYRIPFLRPVRQQCPFSPCRRTQRPADRVAPSRSRLQECARPQTCPSPKKSQVEGLVALFSSTRNLALVSDLHFTPVPKARNAIARHVSGGKTSATTRVPL